MATPDKYSGILVEYLEEGRLRAALGLREQGDQVVVLDGNGRERKISRDLILVRHPDRHATRDTLKNVLAALTEEHQRLAGELDLNLLWEIVHEDEQGRTASALAETFFGHATPLEVGVILDALLADRLYFVRRHMEFVPRDAEQVERLRTQYEKIRLRSEGGKQTRKLLSAILEDGPLPAREEVDSLLTDIRRYLENPFARNRDTAALLESIAGELTPGEAAFEILERMGAAPSGPRFALIGGLRMHFSDNMRNEAAAIKPVPRPELEPHWAVTIDDDDTVEVDDAIACDPMPDGGVRIRVHIALVADFVPMGSGLDTEAAARGTTVYLPETTVRMLPDPIAIDGASLVEAKERNVLTTDVRLSANGELSSYSVYPERIRVSTRLSYDTADQILSGPSDSANPETVAMLQRLQTATKKLRDKRQAAGARIFHRREAKVTVTDNDIAIEILDSDSPSRELVAECMVLSNYITAKIAAERGVPMIYRVQNNSPDDIYAHRARLSLYPEFHSGIGLDCYVQASSPIRRYVDLVAQRQIISILKEGESAVYGREELMNVLAAAETTEAEARELERRAKRYWTLLYLKRNAADRPLIATILRDGSSAEIDEYVIRGLLRGAPNLATGTKVVVGIGQVDPTRGSLTLNYQSTVTVAEEGG
ncbi:MAG TPA: ribonuclease catalytic domain-containing protein [Candidatus Binataceae bacterium]|nr:ribonuclease catalytic domain-containing protein [Candidatus Binataceae bacterium]